MHDNEGTVRALWRSVPFVFNTMEMKAMFRTIFRSLSACALVITLSLTIRPAAAAACNDALVARASVRTGGAQNPSGGVLYTNPSPLSADGRYLVMVGTGLTLSDANATDDVYLHDRLNCVTTLVSVATGGVQANDSADRGAISGDGRYVAFASSANNLVANDMNGVSDIFLHDTNTGITTRVSTAFGGGSANGASDAPMVSSDGRYVVFTSVASNLIASDGNGVADVFLYDRIGATTIRASVANDETERGVTGYIDMTPDGRYVLLSSAAPYEVSDPAGVNFYMRDISTGTTTRIALGDGGTNISGAVFPSAISDDARSIVFESMVDGIVAGDMGGIADVYVHNRDTLTTLRVSLRDTGVSGNQGSSLGRISGDGRYIVFESAATNLIFGDSNNALDIFVHDLTTRKTTRVSLSSTGQQVTAEGGRRPFISSNGRVVAFDSVSSALVPNDTNGANDVFAGDVRLLGQLNLLKNGTFSDPTLGDANTGWGTFATPNASAIDARIQDGVLEFYRTASGSSAVVLQNTGVPIPTGTAIRAYLELGNISPARKRVLAMLHSSDFSDLQVCVFWIDAGTTNAAYAIETFTTTAWTGASLSLYASPAASAGWIQVDNVEMTWNPGGATNQTLCYEPISFGNEPLPDSANLIDNGDFSTPALTGPINGWGAFASADDGTPDLNFLASQFNAGVFEFYRKTGGGSAVILQNTETAIPAYNAVEVVLQIGNSGSARKRLLVMIHDGDFSDLQICSFWIQPNTPLGQHTMISWTTEDWTNAHLSLYASPATNIGWIQVDNVVLRHRPALVPLGTECYGVGASPIQIERRLAFVPAIPPTLVPTATLFAPYAAPGSVPEQPISAPTSAPEPSAGEGTSSE